jgi:hypothetical protein
MSEKASYYLLKLRKQYLIKKSIEICLWALAISALVFGISYILQTPSLAWYCSVAFIVACVILFFSFKLNNISNRDLLSYINLKYPALEESADLIIKDPKELTTLENIQRSRTIDQLQTLTPKVRMPHNIGKAALSFLGTIILVTVLTALDFHTNEKTNTSYEKSGSTDRQKLKEIIPAAIKDFKITIIPPRYTGQVEYPSKNFTLKIPEGSIVTWNLEFTEKVKRAKLSFTGKESLGLISTKTLHSTTKQFVSSTIYQVSWTDSLEVERSSDYYQIEVIPDKSPDIAFIDLRQSIELTLKDKTTIDLRARIADDYALTEAYIIATVAKGSGESVKFREEKLQFSKPQHIGGKSLIAERQIDIKKLGLEPGDELYFYAEAFDNQKPLANRSRTETFFITLLDTAYRESVVDAGLGVDLMPEYFRSQRQIIMDTEKLLRNKKSMSKKEFNFLSNELGYDQKVLRLKYGEFLGEEFESELAPGDDAAETQVETVIEEAKEGEEDMAEKFGHAHDKDNDHNLVEDKKDGHNHEEAKDPDAKENPLEAFVHAHDDEEEATFFLQSVRAKLKAALTEMWDAELYLRLYEPEKSLPFQYKALKLLKEVSNDSRIYVHKTGFDPPPIKEEKRLSADLTEIKNSKRDADLLKAVPYPQIREAIVSIDKVLMNETIVVSESEKEKLTLAGQEIASLALQKPGEFLPALSMIKRIQQNDVKPGELKLILRQLQVILHAALPIQNANAASGKASANSLDQSFIRNLEKLKNE